MIKEKFLKIEPTLNWSCQLAPSMVFGNPLSQVLRTSLNLSEHAWKSGSNLHTKAVVVLNMVILDIELFSL